MFPKTIITQLIDTGDRRLLPTSTIIIMRVTPPTGWECPYVSTKPNPIQKRYKREPLLRDLSIHWQRNIWDERLTVREYH